MLAFAAVSFAQAPRIMTIYQCDGSIDTVSCNVIDTAGATIHNDTLVVPTVTILTLKAADSSDSIVRIPTGNALRISVGTIDSILFPYKGGPAYQITMPTKGKVYRVGDSVTVKWNYNPRPTGQKAYFRMSTDGGTTWKWLTNLVCYMMYKDSGLAGTPCFGGVNYVAWPYVVTNGKYVGTWKFKISNPMAMPDAMADVFNPISDSVIIEIHDYDNSELNHSPMFSIKP
jgi:hypothetical protein